MITGEITGKYAGKQSGSANAAIKACVADINDLGQRIPDALKRSLKDYLKLIAGRLASKHSTNWPGGTSAGRLSRRTGKGVKSIRDSVKVEEKLNDIVGYIGGEFYLRTHEFGAVIRAKRSKYLTIPLPSALDSRGVPLKPRARDWANTFIKKSKRGNLLIFQKRGREIIPLYVLKKSVRIPARLGMKKELETYINLLLKYVEQDILKEFNRGLAI